MIPFSALQKDVISIPIRPAQGRLREESASIPRLALGKWHILIIQGFTKDVIPTVREESASIPRLALGKWQILVIHGFTIDVISIPIRSAQGRLREEYLKSTAVF